MTRWNEQGDYVEGKTRRSRDNRAFGRNENTSSISLVRDFAEWLSGPATYSLRKAALNALTLPIAKDSEKNVKINSMCPGRVGTHMCGEAASRTPEQGASTAIWLATLRENGAIGGFYRDGRLIEWLQVAINCSLILRRLLNMFGNLLRDPFLLIRMVEAFAELFEGERFFCGGPI